MLESCLTFEPAFYDFQDYSLLESNGPVYLLGQCFETTEGLASVQEYVTSLLWFTYRRNFPAIGGTGPSTDVGWGCMLRCGQMLLGQALIRLHLGNNWVWRKNSENKKYQQIVRMFQDYKDMPFSIHQIAQMGQSEKKNIGEWFGPNTAAQVLKKLVVFERMSGLAIHVALDGLLITSDVKAMAKTEFPRSRETTLVGDDGVVEVPGASASGTGPQACHSTMNSTLPETSLLDVRRRAGDWLPLLIIIPLRLGLTSINRCYLPAIQAFFRIPFCMGIIGGRPNHALYFVGMTGEQLIYLDPHVCQDTVNLDEPTSSDNQNEDSEEHNLFNDDSYHCPFLLSIPYGDLDPSLALAFLSRTESEYYELTKILREKLIPASNPPLFELLDSRPKGFPPFIPYTGEATKIQDFTDLGQVVDSDDEYEILQ
ncbi:hypothetical protein AB6A40_006471 [Gnathostoma spinigerum]|uniref:Cysteine protease n=1 Tax=Gnathostoma spinigerum TaxID=75299 RepID=A0ABD6ET93_9BILA